MKENNINMTVKDLKNIIKDLPDDMEVVIPVIGEENANHIYGFRCVRTAGILSCRYEKDSVLCINTSDGGVDIYTQISKSGKDVNCDKLLF